MQCAPGLSRACGRQKGLTKREMPQLPASKGCALQVRPYLGLSRTCSRHEMGVAAALHAEDAALPAAPLESFIRFVHLSAEQQMANM